ncbi:hypothetical protein AVEN_199767-1 [Araneus ventricosus]|uniref:Uncharacterized protein n=1 Tax=Araneus ventricosus TaxID=182803 RepID=A0A4Y2GEK1_ARAVE|nr:hypothetical protein AVEN_199767-1 [Araneus ventricosus]
MKSLGHFLREDSTVEVLRPVSPLCFWTDPNREQDHSVQPRNIEEFQREEYFERFCDLSFVLYDPNWSCNPHFKKPCSGSDGGYNTSRYCQSSPVHESNTLDKGEAGYPLLDGMEFDI